MARLQKFYGGNPSSWLSETPVALIQSMLDCLPKLEAEGQLASVQAGALANGSYKPHDARRIEGALHRAANFGKATKRSPDPLTLASAGIGFEIVSPSSKAEGNGDG